MYCKNCGIKIGEDVNFCPKCGVEQKKQEQEEEDKTEKIEDKTEKIEDKTEKVEAKTGKVETKKKSNFSTIVAILIILFSLLAVAGLYLMTQETRSVPYQESYQEPVYRTEYYQEPVYRTEYDQKPIYGTEYYQEPVYETKTTSYRCGFLSLETCYEDKLVLSRYEQKSKQVFDHNEQIPKQVFDHNEQKSKQVFDRDETKYRTKYKDVTKTKLQWLLNN